MAGMDDLANWMVGTPEFSMELGSLMASMVDIGGMYVTAPTPRAKTVSSAATETAGRMGLTQEQSIQRFAR